LIAKLSDEPISDVVSLFRSGNRWTPDARRRALAFKTSNRGFCAFFVKRITRLFPEYRPWTFFKKVQQ
jgi:hypothetical protein